MGNKGVCALYEEEVEMANPQPFQPAPVSKSAGDRIDYVDGSYYVGDIDKNLPHGNGTYTNGNSYYKGQWAHGLPHGKGEETMKSIVHYLVNLKAVTYIKVDSRKVTKQVLESTLSATNQWFMKENLGKTITMVKEPCGGTLLKMIL